MNIPKYMIEKKQELTEKLNEKFKSCEDEQRMLTQEEVGEIAEMRSQLESIEKTIESFAEANEAVQEKAEEKRSAAPAGRSECDIVKAYISGGALELRDNETKLVNSSGIKLSKFSEDVITKTKDLCGILKEINLVEAEGDYKQIVTNPDYMVHGAWTAEGEEIDVTEARWTTINIPHFKFPSLCVITLEMLNQAAFNPLTEAAQQASLDFSFGAENGIIAGTGDSYNQPTGLITSGTAFNTASAAAISADEIVDIFHSLKSLYMLNAKWIMNNKTLAMIRKLKDSTGNYLFRPVDNMTDGYVGNILGKPVLVSEVMPDVGAGRKPILFGDFKRGYKGVMNPGVTSQVLREKYATKGAIGFLSMLWLGGKPVNAEAYTTVTMPQ